MMETQTVDLADIPWLPADIAEHLAGKTITVQIPEQLRAMWGHPTTAPTTPKPTPRPILMAARARRARRLKQLARVEASQEATS